MKTIAFEGRILFLSQDPDAVARQLTGADLELADAQPLREDISTDEITPIPVLVHYDRELGRYAHTGFETRGEQPIGRDGLLNGGFHLAECEKHFHDHDETWIILKGKGIGFWIDHTGTARNSSSKRVMYG